MEYVYHLIYILCKQKMRARGWSFPAVTEGLPLGMWQSRCCCFILLRKTLWHHTRLLRQLRRRLCVHVFHHRQQHSSGGFGVGLGVVVVELMADVRRQSVEP